MSGVQGEKAARRAKVAYEGVVRPDGRWECHVRNRHGQPTQEPCLAVCKNTNHAKSSHMSSKHKSGSSYQKAQEGGTQYVCDRPAGLVRGNRWCEAIFQNKNTLRAHTQAVHGYRGSSEHLEKPFDALTIEQQDFLREKRRCGFARKANGTGDDPQLQAQWVYLQSTEKRVWQWPTAESKKAK
ncbi:hypothetical protein F5Y17DRAFT_463660 [Xylariaceae sp. FL0594]|nr:hypothetical protein F5Y17DRAFT_463660 [Xylariaceae sp. FL0594]